MQDWGLGEVMRHFEVYYIITLTAICFIAVSYYVKKDIIRKLLFISSAIIAIYCIGTAVGKLERLNYNIWYSSSTSDLIAVTIEKLENGEQELLIKELKKLQPKIYTGYEVKGNYDEHVRETLKNLNAGLQSPN